MCGKKKRFPVRERRRGRTKEGRRSSVRVSLTADTRPAEGLPLVQIWSQTSSSSWCWCWCWNTNSWCVRVWTLKRSTDSGSHRKEIDPVRPPLAPWRMLKLKDPMMDFCDVPSLGLWLQSFIFDLNMKKMSAEVSCSQRRNENLGLTSRFFSCSFCELVSVVGVLCGQWSKQTDLRSGWSDPDWSSVWAASPDHKPFYFLLKTRPKQRRRDRREIRFLCLKKPFVCQIYWFIFQLKNTLLDDIKKIQNFSRPVLPSWPSFDLRQPRVFVESRKTWSAAK